MFDNVRLGLEDHTALAFAELTFQNLLFSVMIEALKRGLSSVMGSTPKTTYKDFDVEDVLEQLNVEEKISLVSGTDFWHTAAVPRLGIPAIRVSDGPNGVRGTKFFLSTPAACLPCGKFPQSVP